MSDSPLQSRTIAAIFIASFAASGAAATLFNLFANAIVFIAIWIVTTLVAATFGLGWHAFALWRRLTAAYWYAVAGAVLGFCLGYPLADLMSFPPGSSGFDVWLEHDHTIEYLTVELWTAAHGAATATLCWLIRRPDRDAANPATPAP